MQAGAVVCKLNRMSQTTQIFSLLLKDDTAEKSIAGGDILKCIEEIYKTFEVSKYKSEKEEQVLWDNRERWYE